MHDLEPCGSRQCTEENEANTIVTYTCCRISDTQCPRTEAIPETAIGAHQLATCTNYVFLTMAVVFVYKTANN